MKKAMSPDRIIMNLIRDVLRIREELERERRRLETGALKQVYERVVRNAAGTRNANKILLDIIDSNLSLTLRSFCSTMLANCVKVKSVESEAYLDRTEALLEQLEIPAFRIHLAFSISRASYTGQALLLLDGFKKEYNDNAETIALIQKYEDRLSNSVRMPEDHLSRVLFVNIPNLSKMHLVSPDLSTAAPWNIRPRYGFESMQDWRPGKCDLRFLDTKDVSNYDQDTIPPMTANPIDAQIEGVFSSISLDAGFGDSINRIGLMAINRQKPIQIGIYWQNQKFNDPSKV